MPMSSAWFSIGPLMAFNVFLLSTVLMFRPIYRKRPVKEYENREATKFLNKWMREYWAWITDPFVKFFIKIGLTPNVLTFIGVVLAFFAGIMFWRGYFGLGGWTMIAAATFDMFDGRVARATNNETRSGAYFDSVMDRVSEGFTFIGLAAYYRDHWAFWVVLMGFLGSVMVSYTRAKGESSGSKYTGGSMQRAERIVYLGVGSIFAPLFAFIYLWMGLPGDNLQSVTHTLYLLPLSFVALMTWFTSLDRIRHIMKELDGQALR